MVRHTEPSLLMSLDDEPHQPSPRLLGIATEVAGRVFEMVHDPIAAHPLLSMRDGPGVRWFEAPTGDHYHLLRAVCQAIEPKVIWEFGTGDGMSVVAMLEGCGEHVEIYTVDVAKREPSWINLSDSIHRIIGDMASANSMIWLGTKIDHIYHADLILVDGPKDGVTEARFCELLDAVEFVSPPIVVFDDIRLMNMVHVWRSIAHPKVDLTSLGHWSGTGIVEWTTSG